MAGGIRRWVAGAVIALLAGVGGSANSRAQEPVFFYNNGAIRYTEAAGVYHYVFSVQAARVSGIGRGGEV